MRPRLVIVGFILWLIATIALRFAGQRILTAHPSTAHVIVLFAVSFLLMAVLIRRVCKRNRLAPEQWTGAAASLLLPTLLLDPFSSAFFPVLFPNMAPEAAGVFGGWMIICCAGGLTAALLHRQ